MFHLQVSTPEYPPGCFWVPRLLDDAGKRTLSFSQSILSRGLCVHSRSLVDTLPEDEEAVLSGQQARRPVAWLLLRPARGPGQQKQPQRAIALPITCDASLPDYIVKTDVFERGMKRHWHKQDRFRMFFASSHTNKTGWLTLKHITC